MRVSKVVKEYIEKQVRKRMPQTEIEIQYESIKDTVNDANEKYHELMKAKSKEIIEMLIKENNIADNMVEKCSNYSYSPFGTWKHELRELADKDRRNREIDIQHKIEEIIVTLELGGTRADLEKMLEEI